MSAPACTNREVAPDLLEAAASCRGVKPRDVFASFSAPGRCCRFYCCAKMMLGGWTAKDGRAMEKMSAIINSHGVYFFRRETTEMTSPPPPAPPPGIRSDRITHLLSFVKQYIVVFSAVQPASYSSTRHAASIHDNHLGLAILARHTRCRTERRCAEVWFRRLE